jgi:hypothetical protein
MTSLDSASLQTELATLQAILEVKTKELHRLQAAVVEARHHLMDAIDACDPVVFEKDWCSEDPSLAFKALMSALGKLARAISGLP